MRALLSVYDKTGIVEFARALHELDVTLVSSGGTASAIADAGIPVTDVADLTGVPAILDHRVVTLHPKVHGGLLADPTNPQHQADMAEYGIERVRPRRVEPVPVPIGAVDRAHRHRRAGDGAGGGEEPRARGHRDQPGPVRDGARRAARARPAHRDDAPRVRARGVRADRRLRRRDRRVAPGGATRCPSTSSCRSPGPTTSCATARTRTSTARATGRSARRAGGTGSCSTAGSRSATSTSTTPRPRGSSPTISEPWLSRRADRSRCAPSSSTPIRVASRWPTIPSPRTSGRSSATSAPRSAGSWRATGRSTTPPRRRWSPVRRPTS